MPSRGNWWLLAAMFCLFAGITLLWLRLDHQPPAWDDAWYLTNSLVLYDAWTDGGMAGLARQFYVVLGFKAPLITALPLPFYLLLGRDWHVAYLVNVVSMGILFPAVYGAVRQCWNARTGLLAVFVVATMPLLYGLARWYLVEYSMAALVAVAMWLLSRSPNLESRLMAFAFGFVCGVGLLLKASFPLFLAVPFLLALWRSERRTRLIGLVAAPCLVLALPWYALHWRPTLANALEAGFGVTPTEAQGTGAIFSIEAIGGYLLLVSRDGLSTYYAVLTALSAIVLLVHGDAGSLRKWKPLWPWVLPFIVFLFAGNKDIRYAAPLYPALAMAVAVALDAVTGGRRWLIACLLVVPMAGILATSFQWPYRGAGHIYARRYQKGRWAHKEILEAVAANTAFRTGEKQVLLLGTDRAAFNANNFELEARQLRLPVVMETTAYERDREAALRAAGNAAFVVFKDGGEPESLYYNVHFRDVVRFLKHSPDAEEVFTSDRLPDGGVARLFRNRNKDIYVSARLAKLDSFQAEFGGMLGLSGLSVRQTAEMIEVKYAWRVLKAVDREYWCFTHVVDSEGRIIGFLDHRLMGGNPVVTSWKPGDEALEVRRLALPPSKTAQKMRLRMGLYHIESGQRLRVVLPKGSVAQVTEEQTALVVQP